MPYLPPPGAAGYLSGPDEHPLAAQRRRRRLVVGRIVVAVVSVAVLLVSGFVTLIADNTGQQQVGLINNCPAASACTGTTILLVGSDARVDAEGNALSAEELAALSTQEAGGGASTDTMMLIHIPAGGGKATAVSIPRDSWIVDPPQGPSDSGAALVDYAPNKVNSYYGSAQFYTAQQMVKQGNTDQAQVSRESSNAGRKMLISVLERLTGAHIDHYAEINLFGFYLLSNAIGGVPVCLLKPVDDPLSGAKFAAGPQEVSGTAALSFVRQRHGLPNGDLDRVRRQQAFLSGAISKVLSVGTLTNPSKLSSLVNAANRSIVLSDGLNLLQLAEQMASISSGNINFETMPTHGAETTTTKDALHVDVAEVRTLFAQIDSESTKAGAPAASGAAGDPAASTAVTTAAVDPASITVDVQNGTMTSGIAKSVSDQAANAGYARGQIANFPGTTDSTQQPATTLRYSPGEDAKAAEVKAGLGFGTPQEDSKVAAGHVLVVIGLDRIGPPGLRGAAVASSKAPGPTAPAVDATAINAATPGCVN